MTLVPCSPRDAEPLKKATTHAANRSSPYMNQILICDALPSDHREDIVFTLKHSLNLSDSPKLRLILIGVREAGKSAAGNAILGKKAFDQVGVKTRVSVSCQGLVRGRQVLVIDTPGWEWFNINGTPASASGVKKEMIRSMSLCQPGAHALLLVVPLSFSFSKHERCAVEEHIELFGPEAWSYALVLFTILDRKQLYGTSIEQEVEENEELHRLVGRCGGRFHALFSKYMGVEDQVADLLAKIQNMVAANGEVVLSSEKILEQARRRERDEERREEEERKKREEKIQKVRVALKDKEKDKELRRLRRGTNRYTVDNVEQKDSTKVNKSSDLPVRDRKSCKQQ
ncbi:GTPase IMAP family member 4-like [Xyrauchen texanus]|uniref:GTPase IMAP family member 4-like n=1 Tax=Xyrauchen texanus TaxID=154827 RepID=UPI0022428458|nr:GTPase IMAP family member 4-like [Xyrauchen texanus]